MDLRINLLPPELLEARRWDKWYRYVFIGFFALLALLLLIGAWVWLSVQIRVETLQGLQQQAQEFSVQAQAFSVFEKRHEELVAQRAVVQTALADRISAGRLADEVSLVLPDETWLEVLSIGEESGLTVAGFTPLSSSQSTNIGYKSVAATMVRLSSLPDLSDVWLSTATSTEYNSWQVEDDETEPTTSQPVVKFAIAGKVAGGAAKESTPTAGSD